MSKVDLKLCFCSSVLNLILLCGPIKVNFQFPGCLNPPMIDHKIHAKEDLWVQNYFWIWPLVIIWGESNSKRSLETRCFLHFPLKLNVWLNFVFAKIGHNFIKHDHFISVFLIVSESTRWKRWISISVFQVISNDLFKLYL